MHNIGCSRATVDRARRPAIVALVAVVLGLAAAVLPAGAAARPGARAAAAGSGCRLYGTADEGYWSNCFPSLNLNVSWHGYNSEAEDKGGEAGTQATYFLVYDTTLVVGTEQSSKLHDRATIDAGLYATCGDEATPDYDEHGKGLLESDTFTDVFYGWLNGRPRKHVFWNPNVAGFQVQLSNCDGGTTKVNYAPGTPLYGDECQHDPRTDPEVNLYDGEYSDTGSIAHGRRDSWDFDCKYTGGDWHSSGQATMAENPCPRTTTGPGYAKLRTSTRAALKRLYKGLDDRGGCYRFRSGWVSKSTHAQNADVVVGFRPMGLAAFAKTRELQKYVVPILRKVADAAGLCGPTTDDPGRYQMPYQTGKEKKPTCHLG